MIYQASKHEKEKKSPTFKDLDFMELLPEGLLLEPETYTALISTMRRDCRLVKMLQLGKYFKTQKRYFSFHFELFYLLTHSMTSNAL